MKKQCHVENCHEKTMSCQKNAMTKNVEKNNVMSKKCHIKNLGSLIKKEKKKSNHLSKLTYFPSQFWAFFPTLASITCQRHLKVSRPESGSPLPKCPPRIPNIWTYFQNNKYFTHFITSDQPPRSTHLITSLPPPPHNLKIQNLREARVKSF